MSQKNQTGSQYPITGRSQPTTSTGDTENWFSQPSINIVRILGMARHVVNQMNIVDNEHPHPPCTWIIDTGHSLHSLHDVH